ncbi:hypothetical protein ACFLSQ_00555 [Bacteroidota bacterium]
MKKILILLLTSGILISLFGCSQTRVEEETYTITLRDTTYQRFVNNAPGNRDNGEIFPSSRTFKNERDMMQNDSIVERKYPDFIRLGLFESIGMIGSSSENGIGTGLFGLFPDFDNLKKRYYGTDDALFTGGIYRIGIAEQRLRWFRDAKNWVWGFNLLEIIAPDALTNHTFISPSFYIKKRYYLREKIPYIAISPSASISLGTILDPFGLNIFSSYANLSASLDIGSLGGLNLRAYVGLIAGMNSGDSWQIRGGNTPGISESQFFPYAGLGFSVLDFHNLVPETEIEWKDHEHSSWDIGLLQIGLLNTGADYSTFSDTTDTGNFIKGMSLRLANASVALPFLNNQFYAGTSLMNLLILGHQEWGLSVLPIRVGYWQTVLLDELSVEPFIEYNYYPSSFFNLGAKLNLALSGDFNLSLLIGYASGSNNIIEGIFAEEFDVSSDFSRAYIGLSIGIADRIFFPEQLRYNK